MTIIQRALLVLAAVAATLSAAWAAGDDVFVVPRVTVQAQADNATAAKTIAQRQGRQKAIDRKRVG